MLERHGHGGDWVTAQELYGRPIDKVLDFSANINPLGPPAAVKEVVVQEWQGLTRYPDPECRELRSAISERYKVGVDSVLAGNGAAELIDLLVRYLRPRRAAVADPTFSEYADALRKSGSMIYSIDTRSGTGFRALVDDIINICQKVDLLFLGQPNNPTGHYIAKADMARILQAAESFATKVILDEAFVDFMDNEAEVSWISESALSRTVIVVRSMTKFYAIPGLRLGYLVAHPEQVRALSALQVPWSVNHLAQKAGVAALSDPDYDRNTRLLIREEREWLRSRLEQLGCTVYGDAANFMLVRLPDGAPDACRIQASLGQAG